MKLKIFFVFKLFFFVSIELSAPYVVTEFTTEQQMFIETDEKVSAFCSFDDRVSDKYMVSYYNVQKTAILNRTVD
jgi:hypothetical protein